jgi:SH3-like domain-containing protein
VRLLAASILAILLAVTGLALAADAAKTPAAAQTSAEPRERGSDSGLMLPRFASLASDKINVRAGPGLRYPVSWTYVRRGLPVEVVAEFDYWRKVRDADGSEGWIHRGMLSPRRVALVQGGVRDIRADPDSAAQVVARAEPGVRVRLLKCRDEWCEVELQNLRGYLTRAEMWGVYPDENVE